MVLHMLKEAGIRINEKKYQFMKKEVEYLGYLINKEGLKPVPEAQTPQNTTQLRAYISMLNYYSKFLKNMSSLLGPMHALLKKNARWLWTRECQKSFEDSKSRLLSADLLVHFDTEKKIILTCDASQYGIGAVMAHIMEDGSERPIAFASRTLAPAEKTIHKSKKKH